MVSEDNYLNLPRLRQFYNKLKTVFATKSEITDIKGDPGEQGVSITKVEQTTSSSSDGGSNVITVTLSDGTSSTFTIKNGSKGNTGAKGVTGTRGSMIYWGITITGTSTTATIFSESGIASALVNDLYINTSTWNIYQCSTAGTAVTAKWTYKGTIKGANGTNATTTAVVSKTANGLAPQLPNENTTTKYLRQDGTWSVPPDTNTKNTAGSTNSSSKLFLIGATSQATNPKTYSHDTAYIGTDGCLYSNSTRVSSELIQSTEPTTQITGDYWFQEY